MERSPSEQPPSLTPAKSGSGQAEYWCYRCNKTVWVKTLADFSQIVCRECNRGFVESLVEDYESENDSGSSDDDDDDDDDVDDDDDDDDGEEGNDRDRTNLRIIELLGGLSIEHLRLILRHFILMRIDNLLESVNLEDESEDESDGDGRTGAPPAAKSVVSSLKTVNVEVEKDVIHCAVCSDLVSVGEVAKELECGHGYHEECILPWLGLRNTCPVCRFELPTDDPDYEEKKRRDRSGGASASGNSPGLE